MAKIKRHLNYAAISILSIAAIFMIIGLCYAQAGQEGVVHAPEPTSIALVSTGLVGWIVQYARMRFREFKRIFDLIVAGIGAVVAAPVVALAAIVIKIVSPGPVFYTQDRVGWGGETFKIFKMRTMRLDAEKHTGPVWAIEDDPRLIKFGKLIRKAHIDELPQLFNVLRGEMSIVGPRPERPVFVEKLCKEIPEYRKRSNVKPGITGLAQVKHKYDETLEDVKKKVKLDLLYIRRMCLMVDMRILFNTIIVSALGKGAR